MSVRSSRNDVILSTKSSKVSRMTRSVISRITAKSVISKREDSIDEISYHSDGSTKQDEGQ